MAVWKFFMLFYKAQWGCTGLYMASEEVYPGSGMFRRGFLIRLQGCKVLRLLD